jgi:hypothetical protein
MLRGAQLWRHFVNTRALASASRPGVRPDEADLNVFFVHTGQSKS